MELARLLLGLLVAGLLPYCFRAARQRPVATQAFTMLYAAYAVFPTLPGWRAWAVWLAVTLSSALRIAPAVQPDPRRVREAWRNWRITRQASPHGPLRPSTYLQSKLTLPAVVLASALAAFYGMTILGQAKDLWLHDRLSVLLSGFLLAVFVGNLVVVRVVRPYRQALPKEDREVGSLHLGTRLGWIERALVFIFITAGQPEAAALAITAKSLVRIPEVREHQGTGFGQYVIVGTLTSLLIAVAVGILVRVALGLPAL
ncbi:hypothetical protein [Micromonospora gifhornensis]|uniref:hypothetical protein n=1 Tax=Micromonospora gifhornensis TaxID=84594 RepID=UPI00366496C5